MTGLRTHLGTAMARAVTGLAMAVAVAVVAPVLPPAAADPAADADAAITAAWEAGGGATGGLGVKNGGIYPAGAGYGQDFAGGKIYFSPQTGAHAMQGAILDEYLALGGPADGDLGLPIIDEGAGRAPGSRNTTFSAADNPVIFWTPDTGAHVVRGAINAAWDKLGGSAATLGVPTDDEVTRGDLVTQNFAGGQLTWNRKTRAFTTTPPELAGQLVGLPIPGDATTAINAARRAAGGATGPLGAATGGQYEIGADGVGQNYAGGKIFYSPATGADVLTGQVLAKYESVGGPGGDLGLPTSSEGDGGLKPTSSIASFAATDEPVIFWTPDFGAVIVRGAMNAAWTKLGGATGELGAPTADQSVNGTVVTQKFSGGAISYNQSTKAFSTEPANLAAQLKGLAVPTLQKPQAPAAGPNSKSGAKWYQVHRWQLLAIAPLAVLLLAVVAGVLITRRRRRVRRAVADPDHDDHAVDHYADDHHGGSAGHDDGEDYREGPVDGADHYDDFRGAPARDPGGYESGPMPAVVMADDARYAPVSMWASPTDRPPAPVANVDVPDDDQDAIDTAPTRIEPETTRLEADTMRLETAPEPAEYDHRGDAGADQHIENYQHHHDPDDGEAHLEHRGDDTADEPGEEPVSGPPSGRHAAIQLDGPGPAQTSLRLALDDPYRAPTGYPVKADTKTGLYYLPGNGRYDRARAEIWFASEEFALTNGFLRG